MLDMLAGLPGPLILLIAALILAGEPALLLGVVLPSVSAALGLGFLAYLGVLPLPAALVTVAVAVILGDYVGYAIGKRSSFTSPSFALRRRAHREEPGEPAPSAPSWLRRGRQAAIRRGTGLMTRHGGRAVFVARWMVGARTLVPRLSGASGMPRRTFVRWSVPAGLSWSAAYVLAGYLAGSAYEQVSEILGTASLGLVALAAAAIGAVAAGRWAGRVGQRPARFGALTLLLVFALIGVSLAALVALAVHGSGLPRLDAPVAAALTDSPHNWLAAVFLRFTPGSAVIAAAGTLVLIRPVHSGRHRDDPLGGLAVAGATLPLLLLTLVLHGAEAFAHRSDLFAIQNAVLTTAVALATWTFARKRSLRRVRWVVWTLGFAAVLLVAAARLYVGWGTVSSTAAALLIGLIWAGVFTAAWAVRPAPTQTSSGSRYRTRPAEATVLPQDSHGVTPVQQAVVQIGKGLNLVPALAGGSGLGTSSAM